MKKARLVTAILAQGQFPQEHLPLLGLLPWIPNWGLEKVVLPKVCLPSSTQRAQIKVCFPSLSLAARECGLLRVQSLLTFV